MMNAIPALILRAHGDGSVDFINQRWLDYTGLEAGELLGWGWRSVIHPEDLDRFVQERRTALAEGHSFENEARVRGTNIARMMVTRWGMSDQLGTVQLAPRENPYLTGWGGGHGGGFGGERPFSETTAAAIDAEVRRIIDECHAEAGRLLGAHRAQLDLLAAALVARETLDGQEILEITGLPRAPAVEESKPVAAATNPDRVESATLAVKGDGAHRGDLL
jgi:PAS domain S-box-containing protein